MVGGIITYENYSYPVTISFDEFCKSVAAHIGTPPEQLTIAYRFRYNLNVKYQRRPDLYTGLRNEADFHKVIDRLGLKLSGARTRSIILEIYNTVNVEVFPCSLSANMLFTQNPAHHASARAKKQDYKENTNPVSILKRLRVFPLA